MFIKLFAFLILTGTAYILGVFFFPESTDTYGNKEWNMKIREYKKSLENFSSWSLEAKSLIQNVQDIAKPYIDESQKTIQEVQITAKEIKTTIDTKTQEVKQAADSVEKAYKAVEWAKNDIQKLSPFGTGSR